MKAVSMKWIAPLALFGVLACDQSGTGAGDNDTLLNEDENAGMTMETESANAGYVDLNTGEKVDLWYDDATGQTMTRDNRPIELYINLSTGDTVYGRGRYVVNNLLVLEDGKYKLDEAKIKRDGDEWKYKSDDTKIKVEDGEMKMKTDDKKIKVDEDGTKIDND